MILTGALGLALLLQGAAQTPAPKSAPKLTRGHFVRTGPVLACVETPESALKNDSYEYCLQIGPLRIGMPRAEAEKLMGAPVAKAEDVKGEAVVYALGWTGAPGDRTLTTYVAVVYDGQGRAKMIQLSGKPRPERPWGLSGLSLGSSDTQVVKTLGAPMATRLEPYNLARHWSYPPWPISFEVKNRQVISIRVDSPP